MLDYTLRNHLCLHNFPFYNGMLQELNIRYSHGWFSYPCTVTYFVVCVHVSYAKIVHSQSSFYHICYCDLYIVQRVSILTVM